MISTHLLNAMWTYLTQSYVDLLELPVFPVQARRTQGYSQYTSHTLPPPGESRFEEATALDGTCYVRDSPHSFVRREGWKIPRV